MWSTTSKRTTGCRPMNLPLMSLRQVRVPLLLMALWLVASAGVVRGQATPEFRGMWASRFEWPSTSLSTTQYKIDQIMTNLAAHRFNAVVMQVRGQADTLYPSPYEPWSPIVSPDGQTPAGWGSFDPLQYAIDAAHTRGLEFHAYINTHVCYQSGTPSTPDHLFWHHCNAANPSARDWLIHDESGNPVQYASDNYVWIAPGVPDAQAYTRKQVMYVVENYNVDGVHFDRIRTPGTAYSHDPISQARRFGEGNPSGLSFDDWTRDQFTRMLCDLYAQIAEVRPDVKVSCAPLGLYRQNRYPGYPSYFQYGYSVCYQDAQAWIAAGAMDALMPQIYWADGGSLPDFSDVLPDWVWNNAGRHIYAGHNVSTGGSALVSDVNTCRTVGAEGNVVWSYSGFNSQNLWATFSSGVYSASANVPNMPWKDSPADGIIIGNLTLSDGVTPIVDAHVQRSGSSHVALSSGDGLYSFLKVPPGTYSLTFSKPGVADGEITGVTVAAGQVRRVDVSLSQQVTVSIEAEASTVMSGRSLQFMPTILVPAGDNVLSYAWTFGDDTVSGSGMPTVTDHIFTDIGLNVCRLDLMTSGTGPVSSNQLTIDVTPTPGDFDGDGDVDVSDFGHLQACLTGPVVPQTDPACENAMLDGDVYISDNDVDLFLQCLTGPDVAGDPYCME